MGALPGPLGLVDITTHEKRSKDLVEEQASNEFVFAVVGHAGSGTSVVGAALKTLLESISIGGTAFEVFILKARSVIQDWAVKHNELFPADNEKTLNAVKRFQELGDEMRKEPKQGGEQDHAAVVRGLIQRIPEIRARQLGIPFQRGVKVNPNGKPRAYILDSIRHPAEVNLLRHVYGDAFILIGVVCEEDKRKGRILQKYNCGPQDAEEFMKIDADSEAKHGQHVADAFHLADFFVDNTVDRQKDGSSNREWLLNEDLNRLLKIITHAELIRPKLSETAMYHAYSAQMQSACLSRQVGAAVVDKRGNVLSTGTNEVPKAGGGVYGESSEPDSEDCRCGFYADKKNRYCRNTKEQNEIINELLGQIKELNELSSERKEQLKKEIRKTRVGGLLEFSRAVHAEMDALLSAGRRGTSVVGALLFVTAFPCHYCARHLIGAGIEEVQYIEPYPKSKALRLHHDSIVTELSEFQDYESKGIKKVFFHPFSGVAPRLYKRAFLKNRELKVKDTGEMDIQKPEWTSPWHLPMTSYVEMEAKLTGKDHQNG